MSFGEIKNQLSKFRVGIAGAGGLGSNCAIALARSGIGIIVICDFDTIEATNLNRQYYFAEQIGQLKITALKYNILKINPAVTVVTCHDELNRNNIPEVFRGCDVIVEALDSPEMKEMLIETVQLKMKGTPLIVGSGLAGWGKNESIKSRKIDETLYLCGDESTGASDDMPVFAPRVAIVANMQANLVLELLLK